MNKRVCIIGQVNRTKVKKLKNILISLSQSDMLEIVVCSNGLLADAMPDIFDVVSRENWNTRLIVVLCGYSMPLFNYISTHGLANIDTVFVELHSHNATKRLNEVCVHMIAMCNTVIICGTIDKSIMMHIANKDIVVI